MISRSQIQIYFISLGVVLLTVLLSWTVIGFHATEQILYLIVGLSLASIIGVMKLDRYLMLLLIASLPFSMELDFGMLSIHFPSEGFAGLLCLSYFIRVVIHKENNIFHWTTSHLGLIYFILVLLITTATSTHLNVSIKYTLVWGTYMFIGLVLLPFYIKNREISIKSFFALFSLSIGVLILFTIVNYGNYGFERSFAPVMARPFFKDHTLFSAFISLYIPMAVVLASQIKFNSNIKYSFYLFSVLGILLIFLASSRAAWLGIVFAIFCFLVFKLKIRSTHLLFLGIASVITLWFIWPQIEQNFASNRYNSDARDSGIKEQALSVTNISSDVSNMERINRWNCAVRMFKTKPVFGYGPGTYQFEYLPFQERSEMTRISVTKANHFKDGHGGTAHSEVFLSLSEMGGLGISAWIILWITIFIQAKNRVDECIDKQAKYIYVAFLCSISTYFIHSLFNNFLNISSFGIFFWLLVGFIFIPPKYLVREKL